MGRNFKGGYVMTTLKTTLKRSARIGAVDSPLFLFKTSERFSRFAHEQIGEGRRPLP